ncbi:phosphatase PAP2 family protein [Bacillus sp. T33-2]|uniref:phosphatase PAP2 family protein n=1 Tax=Bacillus sp. T33-2 TaxID=2054168 RepID=UPI000C773B93|nr:phosphatase PAP2 family protein [Bacillus sp. T33-2]PLR98840.1 hypothetical protein CVD19_04190 [Bacillus sp. T33-2]
MILNKPTKMKLIYAALIIGILFSFIGGFIETVSELSEGELDRFDHAIINVVQSYISPKITSIVSAITFLGSVRFIAFCVIFIFIILLMAKKTALALFIACSSALGAVFNVFLKSVFKRERPDIQRLVEETSYSFPSGHSMGSFIFYGAVGYIIVLTAKSKRLSVLGAGLMAILIIAIGISRIYLGVHYPSDVIGGFCAGGAWLMICIIGFRLYEIRSIRKKRVHRSFQ